MRVETTVYSFEFDLISCIHMSSKLTIKVAYVDDYTALAGILS